jgi:nucleotide-binding universal stress UspA family protein
MSNVFSRILVGIDDSEASKDAAAFGARLAHEHGGQLILCNSVNWLPVVSQVASSGAIVDTTTLVGDLKQIGKEILDRAVGAAQRDGIEAQTYALEGEPAQRILELAADAKCSLIVMGTHGRQGVERLFIGSTTEAVLRGSTIPVLTVRSGMRTPASTRRCFERVVVGIDESEPSKAAVQTVLELPSEDLQQVFFYSVAGTGDDAHEQAERVIGKALAAARVHGISAKGHVVGGTPAEMLITAAQQRGADLIVLGSHGRRGLQRLFLGSVAEHLVRSAPVPVLVVRTREGATISLPVASASAATAG